MNNINVFRVIDYFAGIPICFVLTILNYILGLFRSDKRPSEERVLFVKISEMGSMILAYSAMMEVKNRLPDAEFYFLTFGRNTEGVEILGLFDKEKILTIRDNSLFGFIFDVIKILVGFSGYKFTVVYDLELFSRFSVILAYLTGAGKRIGFANYTAEGLYRGDLLTHKVQYNTHRHIACNFLALAHATFEELEDRPLLKRAISDAALSVPAFAFDAATIEKNKDRLAAAGFTVIVNPDAGRMLPIRNWGAENYAEVIDQLMLRHDANIVLVGTEDAAECGDYIVRHTKGGEKLVNLIGQTRSIGDLVHVIQSGDLFLTNDSGPAHFASLTDTPTIVFFGPETPELYGPISDNCLPLYGKFACSPCLTAANHRRSPCRNNLCLKAITPSQVLLEIEKRMTGQ